MSFALSEPPRLTAAALAMSDNISLSGDTPVPTAPNSIDGDTEVGSDDGSPEKKKEHFAIEEDVEQARKEVVQPLAVTFPEGGAAAWCAVAGATLCLLSTFGLSNSFGVFQQYYRNVSASLAPLAAPNSDALAPRTNSSATSPPPSPGSVAHTSASSFAAPSAQGSDSTTASASLAPTSSYPVDTSRSFRYQLAFGSALWVFGMFMLSLSKTYIQLFLSQSVCLGVSPFRCSLLARTDDESRSLLA